MKELKVIAIRQSRLPQHTAHFYYPLLFDVSNLKNQSIPLRILTGMRLQSPAVQPSIFFFFFKKRLELI